MKVFLVNGEWIREEDMTEEDWKASLEELEKYYNEWMERKTEEEVII